MTSRTRSAALAAIAAAALLLAILLVRAAFSTRERIETTTAEVTRGPVTRRVLVTGTLKPARMVETGAQVSGTIQSIDADFNAPVRAGQVIARLDPSTYQAQLTEAIGRLAQAQAEHARLRVAADDARVKLERAQQLAGDQLIPAIELEAAQLLARQAAADLKAAAADIDAARATVKQAEVSLAHTIIRSPIDGVVVSRSVDVGQTLAASVQTPVLFSIADLQRMQLLAEIGEADVGGVRPGSTVTFEVESIGREEFQGKVAEVRLQPMLAQAGSSASGSQASTPPGATGTSGSQPAGGTQAQTPARSMPQPPSQQIPVGGATQSASASAPGSGAAPGQSGSSPSTSGTSSSTQTAAQPPGAPPVVTQTGVVTYVAVIDVDNTAGTLNPGGSAVITLTAGERPDVVRVPNTALAFEPTADMMRAAGQDSAHPARREIPEEGKVPGPTRNAYVWKLQDGRFVPVAIEIGLSDDSWTEVVSGGVSPGDRLVTAATVRGR